MQKKSVQVRPLHLIECRMMYHPRELIIKYTKPGQQRRSLLGMIGTVGEFAFLGFIKNAIVREGLAINDGKYRLSDVSAVILSHPVKPWPIST